ncbi:unnamed protein product [Linum tenue]|uniref:Uncharacterized protein n=1 Tax=Linum tenue TaxID=586396 RepID=A0AAV0HGA8_9ROSI|nr:unnamed protein product [Linum tenue]
MKHLSSTANVVVHRCAKTVGTNVEILVAEFEAEAWKEETGEYSKKLVEFCCSKALRQDCQYIEEKIVDGSFSRFTFDMMLAWETPTSQQEQSNEENAGKSLEDRKKIPTKVTGETDEIPLFYSDIMPLLVDDEPSVGEDAVVWMGTLVPLVVDFVNGRFTFESLTAATAHRLFYPAYDKFLKEIDQSIKNLQKQVKPKGVELADDEFILHVDGTASSQRVVRHIGGTSWPGRLTLTNYALYFEASGVVTYEDAIKIDLSSDAKHSIKATATGPWGAPVFDRAIIYESPELSEGIVLEFPEMTSSTRRDHWLALVKEIILMHQFLSRYNVKCEIQAWEIHSRTVLGIVRLHAARELLRISPPDPTKFLIFALYDELPKGDYVLDQLAASIETVNSGHPCSASSILRNINVSQLLASSGEVKLEKKESGRVGGEEDEIIRSSLDSAVHQVREEAKAVDIAKATTEGLKEEGIGESAQVLMELTKPVRDLLPWFVEIVSWERPSTTLIVFITTIAIIYKEWVGKAVAAFLLRITWRILQARRGRADSDDEIVVHTGGEQKSTTESIVAAQFGLRTVHEIMQAANIAILKIWSLMSAKAPKQHSDRAMMVMGSLALILAVIPLKYILMGGVVYYGIVTSKLGKYMENDQGNRRLKEWWDSIPVVGVRVVDEPPPASPPSEKKEN